MKINKQWVKAQDACEGGAEWFNNNYSEDVEGIEVVENLLRDKTNKSILSEYKSDESLSWANWLIVRLMTRKQYLRYTVFAAEQVIHIYEKKYPKDQTIRACIEASKAVIENDTKENRKLAAAAWDAARAAGAAAGDAAWDAARAARAAARDAAGAAMLKKILLYGVSLLRE